VVYHFKSNLLKVLTDFYKKIVSYIIKIKKMYNKIYIALSFLFIISIAACKKTSDVNDTTPPTIEIIEPTPNETFPALTGDCHMEFNASDDVELSGIIVDVINAAGTNFYTNSLSIRNKTYEYHDHLVLSGITSVTPFTLKITVIDKSGNTTKKDVPFKLRP
jgi:hypothetical protein